MGIRDTYGILVDWADTNSYYQREIIEGIHQFTREHDINTNLLMIGSLNDNFLWEKQKNRLIELISPSSYQGFLILTIPIQGSAPLSTVEERLSHLLTVPCVSIGSHLGNIPSVLLDNRTGFRSMITHLIEKHGYRDFGFINGPSWNLHAYERKKIFINTLAEFNITVPDSNIYEGDFIMKTGRDGVRELLETRKLSIQALICGNDDIAIGAWRELQLMEYSVPEDMAITGFDNRSIKIGNNLTLTTVDQHLFEIGRRGAEILYSHILGTLDNPENYTCTLETSPVYGSSCSCSPYRGHSFEDVSLPDSSLSYLKDALVLLESDFNSSFRSNNPQLLYRSWKKLITRSYNKNIKLNYLLILCEELRNRVVGKKKGTETGSSHETWFLQLINMAQNWYTQNDITDIIVEENFQQEVTLFIEDFSQSSAAKSAFSDYQGTLTKVMDTIQSPFCSISVFNELPDLEATSTLLYAYKQGKPVSMQSLSDTIYVNRDLIPPVIYPENRYDIVTALLYEKNRLLGIFNIALNTLGSDIFERLRNRISAIIYSTKTTRNLNSEIEIRLQIERQLKKAMTDLKELSLADDLTGLYNRRGFLTLGEQSLKQCTRSGKTGILFFVDMDNLKHINDSFGHDEGDYAIITIADVLRESFRETDIIGRLGGDEFAIFCENVGPAHLKQFIGRIDSTINAINSSGRKDFSISISYGSSSYTKEINTLEKMLMEADENMYIAKKKKRST